MSRKKPVERTALQDAIDHALVELAGHEAHTPEYNKIVDQLTKLHGMQEKEKSAPVSKDTLIVVGGNLAAVLVIVAYEQKHVVTSKAMSLIGKFR